MNRRHSEASGRYSGWLIWGTVVLLLLLQGGLHLQANADESPHPYFSVEREVQDDRRITYVVEVVDLFTGRPLSNAHVLVSVQPASGGQPLFQTPGIELGRGYAGVYQAPVTFPETGLYNVVVEYMGREMTYVTFPEVIAPGYDPEPVPSQAGVDEEDYLDPEDPRFPWLEDHVETFAWRDAANLGSLLLHLGGAAALMVAVVHCWRRVDREPAGDWQGWLEDLGPAWALFWAASAVLTATGVYNWVWNTLSEVPVPVWEGPGAVKAELDRWYWGPQYAAVLMVKHGAMALMLMAGAAAAWYRRRLGALAANDVSAEAAGEPEVLRHGIRGLTRAAAVLAGLAVLLGAAMGYLHSISH